MLLGWEREGQASEPRTSSSYFFQFKCRVKRVEAFGVGNARLTLLRWNQFFIQRLHQRFK